ncbi:hypothetical protein EYF80_049140 [Liparis tanakae]|uniref:Uncharacterized protein n=1 Tax=Liparis tanakae TaxID=230148 RepID=A0A4Z2FHR0_9TELE|nr:hypothetical protein EYF80_049140 [Liparis tanakae]
MALVLVEGLRRLGDVLRVELRGGAPAAARCPVEASHRGGKLPAGGTRFLLGGSCWEDAAPWWRFELTVKSLKPDPENISDCAATRRLESPIGAVVAPPCGRPDDDTLKPRGC